MWAVLPAMPRNWSCSHSWQSGGFSGYQAACSDNSILDNVSKMLLDHGIAPKPSEVPYCPRMTLKTLKLWPTFPSLFYYCPTVTLLSQTVFYLNLKYLATSKPCFSICLEVPSSKLDLLPTYSLFQVHIIYSLLNRPFCIPLLGLPYKVPQTGQLK